MKRKCAMTKPILRVGICGFGMIGKVHAAAYAAMPYYAEPFGFIPRITHVATAHQETAQIARETIGCEFGVTDFREITENPEIDVVHICTPNADHAEAILSAIRHKKHIYCDKPLCVSSVEAEKIAAALREKAPDGRLGYDRTAQMTFHNRFFPAMMRAKQLLVAGRLGRIFQYRLGYYHASATKADAPFRWKNGPGGGVRLDLVSHLLDLIDSLIGLPSELLAESQIAHSQRRDADTPDRMHVVTTEESLTILTRGKTDGSEDEYAGVIEATKLATGYEDEARLEIHGEKGGIRFRLMNPHELEFFDATESDRPFGGDAGWTRIAAGGRYERPDLDFPSPKATAGWIRAHIACLSHFLQSVERGEPGNPGLLQGVRIQKALDVVERSAKARTWVSLENLG